MKQVVSDPPLACRRLQRPPHADHRQRAKRVAQHGGRPQHQVGPHGGGEPGQQAGGTSEERLRQPGAQQHHERAEDGVGVSEGQRVDTAKELGDGRRQSEIAVAGQMVQALGQHPVPRPGHERFGGQEVTGFVVEPDALGVDPRGYDPHHGYRGQPNTKRQTGQQHQRPQLAAAAALASHQRRDQRDADDHDHGRYSTGGTGRLRCNRRRRRTGRQ